VAIVIGYGSCPNIIIVLDALEVLGYLGIGRRDRSMFVCVLLLGVEVDA
jgi:hypothetical protein